MLQSVASTLTGLGMPEHARVPQEEALEICRRELTDADRLTIEVVRETSVLYQFLGRLDESERLARLAVAKSQSWLSEIPPISA